MERGIVFSGGLISFCCCSSTKNGSPRYFAAMFAFSPTKTTPLLSPGGCLPAVSVVGGSILPSYQKTFTGGRPLYSGNSYLMIDHFGGLSTVLPSLNACTTAGFFRSSDQKAVFIR